MTPDELTRIRNLVATMADPVGNWHMAWDELCQIVDLDPKQFRPPFKPHPFYNPPENQQ